jgi:hypothetical protein
MTQSDFERTQSAIVKRWLTVVAVLVLAIPRRPLKRRVERI